MRHPVGIVWLGVTRSQVRTCPSCSCWGAQGPLKNSQWLVFVLGIAFSAMWNDPSCFSSPSGHNNILLEVFFWELSEMLLSFQTKLSECVVVCRQNWQKVSVLTTSNKSKLKKVESGSVLVMSKQLPECRAFFFPLWEAVEEHHSNKIPVQFVRPPVPMKYLLQVTIFAGLDCYL